jgi:hypothetical protein
MSYDLGGPEGTSFAFDSHGDSVTGQILEMEEVQQTDMTSGDPAYWPDGKPKMMHRVTLQTALRDDADDTGQRSVYLRGARKPESQSTLAAVLEAVKATTGGTAIDQGATLTLTYIGDRPGAQKGFTAKCYSATYRPPSTDLGGAPVGGAPAQAQQALPYPPPTPQQAYQGPPQQQAAPAYAPTQVAAQQTQQAPPAIPPSNQAGPGPKGWLNGQPIMPAQYAGMVAAGVVPEQIQGWIPA